MTSAVVVLLIGWIAGLLLALVWALRELLWPSSELSEAVWERSRWGFSLTAAVIQAWNVDRAEPRPDGRDCQEDEALPV